MKNRIQILSRAARRFFEGESGAAPAGGTTAVVEPPAPAPAPAPTPPGRTFTQVELNNLVQARVAEVQKKAADTNKKTVEQLQTLQQDQQLTQQQRDALQSQIEELQATYRTAEETKKIEIDRLTEKHTTTVKKLTDERDTWRRQHDSNMIEVAISRAAVKYDAVSPEQIEAFLRPLTRVAEELDAAGKPTGKYVARVKFEDVDAENKPLALELSTDDAVKLMRERTNRFGNLFKNTTSGGTGAVINPNPGGGPSLNLANMTPAEYRKNRPAIHQKMRDDRAKSG